MTVKTIEKLKNMRVLLIDDDKWIRSSLEYYFQKKTLVFEALEDAGQGFETVNFQDFDIIICDYKLPGANGIEVLNAAARVKPDIIRILITAFADDHVISMAQKTGVDDFIAKPFKVKDIENALEKLVKN